MSEQKILSDVRLELFKTVKNYGAYIFPSILITAESLTETMMKIPITLQNYIAESQELFGEMPKDFRSEYRLVYFCDVPSLIGLTGDEKLVAGQSGLAYEKVCRFFHLEDEADEKSAAAVLDAVHQIGEELCALRQLDYRLCPNVEILVYISGLRRQGIQEYVTGRRKPMPATEALLLDALHKHGQMLKDLQLLLRK